nr:hypothetical protein [Tanacetum cinerariifolium]
MYFFDQDDMLVNHEKINDFILAEISDKNTDSQLYRIVSNHMMHGLCRADNLSCPCTPKGKCTKQFPNKFSEPTMTDSDGFSVYKRPNNGRFIEKVKVKLHNGFVVETINEEVVDEIKDYYDCRYLSACEATWRILGMWEWRKQGYAVGRIHQVPASLGEAYYVRVLLNKVKRKTSWEEVRTVNGKLYDSFRDACFTMRLLDDDKEYIKAIKEGYHTSFGDYVRHLFVMLLMSNSIARPDHAKDMPFEGKVIVFGGDFRQILPVIPGGTRQDEFGDWILKMEDGRLGGPNDDEATIDIPDDILVSDNRAILAPTHDVVGVINDRLLSQIPGEEVVYYSSDSICKSEGVDSTYTESLYSPEVLNGLKLSGIPNRRLALKVGASIMLLRNINQTAGLCNGTRLRILKFAKHVIEA